MNASQLRDLVDLILEKERHHQLQQRLGELLNRFNELAGNPQNTNMQTQMSAALDVVRTTSKTLRESFTPAQIASMREINAQAFFADDLAGQIDNWIQQNPMTPAVVQQKLRDLVAQRDAYIQRLTQLQETLETLGIERSTVSPGDAEVQLLIPREFFRNHLDLLVKELGTTNQIFRTFSEAAIGAAEPVEVRQISTSDPLFLFGLDPRTVAMIAAAVTWALGVWAKIENVRKVRAETRSLNIHTEAELKVAFDNKIEEQIAKEVESQVTKMIGPQTEEAGRKTELRAHVEWALNSILARLEHGVRIEVRSLPAEPPPDGADQTTKAKAEALDELQKIQSQLAFPKIEGPPILKLPPSEPPRSP